MELYGGVQRLLWTHPNLQKPTRCVGSPLTASIGYSHIAEEVKVVMVTHFRFKIMKPEMNCYCNLHSLCNLGSVVEACAGFPHPTAPEAAVVCGESREAPTPLCHNTIMAIVLLPFPLPYPLPIPYVGRAQDSLVGPS